MMENDYAVKVAKYPPTLGDDYLPEDEFGPGSKMLRGPGQKAADPFQFVAVTKGGAEMAESAKNTLQITQQQKAQREKMLQEQRQLQKFDDSEPWQADLDTWRRKRKEKFGDRAASEIVETPRKSEEYRSYAPRRTSLLPMSEDTSWPRWSRLFPHESLPRVTRDGHVHVELRDGRPVVADVEVSGTVPSSFVQLFDEAERRAERVGPVSSGSGAGASKTVKWDEQNLVSKEEILQVSSAARPALPRQHSASTVSPLRSSSDDLNNDSGIDNRTVESPSTSEFSPRSTDLFVSPKSVIDEEPPHHPPPPPPVEDNLDQVLIPLKYSKAQDYSPIYRSLEKTRYYDQREPEEEKIEDLNSSSYFESHRSIEKNSYMPVTSARVEATFKQPPPREGVKPFVSRAAQELHHHHQNQNHGNLEQKVENIDLTVELNREQKATVTATKYPRSDFIMEDHHQPRHAPPLKSSSTTRIYHAVDIPFDESPPTKTYSNQRHSKQDGMFTLNVIMGSQPVHKGMGFSTGKRDTRVIVESVIVGSPADKAGLLVGDTILSINGEDMSDKYQSGVTRILHEAARVGEADILILRAPAPTPVLTKQTSSSSVNSSNFDKARSVFTENKSFDSYAEFKRKHTKSSRDSTSSSTRSSRDYNSLPRGTGGSSGGLDRKRDASLSSYRTAKDNFNSNSSARSSGRSEYGDYRVSTYQEKNAPGRLTDFVPEVDRRLSRREQSEEIYSKLRGEENQPRTIRNYHLSNENIARTNMNYDGRRDSEEESTTTTLKRSTLPRSGTNTSWKNDYSDEDVAAVEEKVPVKPREPSPLRSALKKPAHNYYPEQSGPRRYYSTESLQQRNQRYSDSDEDEEMYQRRLQIQKQRFQQVPDLEYHTVGSYGVHPAPQQQPQQQQRSRSAPRHRYGDTTFDDVTATEDVSAVTHRFYDRAGNHVKPPRDRSRDIHIQREYGSSRPGTREVSRENLRDPRDLDFVRDTYQWEEMQETTRKTTTTEEFYEESRDWRDVINQQRQPAPGYNPDRRGIAATSASLSNLPTYINRRMEKEKEKVKEHQYSMPPPEVPLVTEKYERDEYTRVEERQYPVPVARNTAQQQIQSQSQQQTSNSSSRDEVVAVSGKHRCAHCNEELGRGAAMIVESLNLFYHLACFKCYVCKTSLGSGATGADVRVRDGRLHCQTCYSNDRVQLSKV